jgi:hypothetical protein
VPEAPSPPSAASAGELPEPPVTGDEAVDGVIAALAEGAGDPLEDRVGVLEKVQRTLQDRLADVEE